LVLAETAFMAPVMVGLRAVMRLRWWPVLAPAVWVAGEWARGGVPVHGFPWGRLAQSAIDTPFAPSARLAGMKGTSVVLAVVEPGGVPVRRLPAGSVGVRGDRPPLRAVRAPGGHDGDQLRARRGRGGSARRGARLQPRQGGRRRRRGRADRRRSAAADRRRRS